MYGMGRNVGTCFSPVGASVSVGVCDNGTSPDSLRHVGVQRIALAPPVPRILETGKMQTPPEGMQWQNLMITVWYIVPRY